MEYKIKRFNAYEDVGTYEYMIFINDKYPRYASAIAYFWLSSTHFITEHINKLCMLCNDEIDTEQLWDDLSKLENPTQETIDLYITAINIDWSCYKIHIKQS